MKQFLLILSIFILFVYCRAEASCDYDEYAQEKKENCLNKESPKKYYYTKKELNGTMYDACHPSQEYSCYEEAKYFDTLQTCQETCIMPENQNYTLDQCKMPIPTFKNCTAEQAHDAKTMWFFDQTDEFCKSMEYEPEMCIDESQDELVKKMEALQPMSLFRYASPYNYFDTSEFCWQLCKAKGVQGEIAGRSVKKGKKGKGKKGAKGGGGKKPGVLGGLLG